MSKEIRFPKDYNFIFVPLFGDTARVRLLEFFLYISAQADARVFTYISQISRLLDMSKSSVKKNVDELIESGILDESTVETHAQNPKRNLSLNEDNEDVRKLRHFYNDLQPP